MRESDANVFPGDLPPETGGLQGIRELTKLQLIVRGRRLYEQDRFRILRVEASDGIADDFFRWDRLDGIGPACFATIEELADSKVVEVNHEI